MKNILSGLHLRKMHILLLLASTLLFCSCQNKKNNLFYYSGDQKIEFSISGDTLGFLLRDTTLNAPGDTITPGKKIQLLFDSSLNSLGFDAAGVLTDDSIVYENVRLRVNKTPNASLMEKERVARQLKKNNRALIAYSGYLVRTKNTNQPLIVTDEIIVEFNPGISQADIDAVFSNYGLEVRKKNPFVKLQFTVGVTDSASESALIISQQLKNNARVRFAQINLIHIKTFHSQIPLDEYFPLQWHHVNDGTDPSIATEDADIDTDRAWNFTMGSSLVKIAVFDNGLDVGHEDLKNNFSYNSLERPWNGQDEDANLMIDDTIGWNFIEANNNLYPPSECSASGCYSFHGTAVMGLAAGETNTTGVTGVCPECNLIPIRTDQAGIYDADGIAFAYARTRSARIFVVCWDYNGTAAPDNVRAAINDATAADILVFVSMSNFNVMDCIEGGLTSLPNVFAVSRSDSKDVFDQSGFGNCVDLLGPTSSLIYSDRLKMTTTDVMGDSGNSYFDGVRYVDGNCGNYRSVNYTTCFGGTSAATPIVAGTAGLILSANPMLSARQVQHLLQDCADKIDTSVSKYSPRNGRSTSEKSGYGRLNAYEAVKIASADQTKGGRNGVDIFLRDNYLDWGNTEQPSSCLFESPRGTISHWTSMDIKVDAPPFVSGPIPLDNGFFEDRLANENPIGGRLNKVYVRVRNRGFRTAGAVIVKLYWVHAGASLPPLPSDFWEHFLEGSTVSSDWNSLGTQPIFNLAYSGASSVGTAGDGVQIVSFDFNTPVHDPSTRNHYCLMAIVSSPDDIMPTPELLQDPQRLNMDYVTKHFNNATHKNYNIETADAPFTAEFYIYNPSLTVIETGLDIKIKGPNIPVLLPDSIKNRYITLNKNEKRRVRFTIDPTGLKEPAEITIRQTMPGEGKDSLQIIGGITYFVMPSTKKSSTNKK